MSSSNPRPENRGFRSALRCAIFHYRQSPSLSAAEPPFSSTATCLTASWRARRFALEPPTTPIGNGAMFKHQTDTLKIGDPAPYFSLPSVDGSTYSRDDLLGAVSMIVFFRGTW